MRILFVKTSSLGDIAQCTAIADWIKNNLPDAKIHWAVEKPFAPLLQAFPSIDKTIEIDTKSWRQNFFKKTTYKAIHRAVLQLQETPYDVVFDLQGNCKSAVVTFLAKAKDKAGFGRKSAAELLNPLATTFHYDPPSHFTIYERYLHLVANYFGVDKPIACKATLKVMSPPFSPAGSPAVLLFPSSNWPNKTLSTEQAQTLIEDLQRKNSAAHFSIFWGNENERNRCKEIASPYPFCTVVEKCYSPLELISLMDAADLIISADSFALHLAGHTKTPLFSFFGPSNGALYAPQREGALYFQGTCPYGIVFEKRCPHLRTCKTGACLKTEKNILNQSLNKLLVHKTRDSSTIDKH